MTNHKQEAVEYLDHALNEEDPAWAQVRLAHAQVCATLALVEQQRIANLIALTSNPNIGIRYAYGLYDLDGKTVTGLRPEVASALGIGDEND